MKRLLSILALSCGCLAQGIPVGSSSGQLPMTAMPSGYTAFPAGGIILTLASSCPTGWTEVASLNGKFVLGTVAANANVGTSGGSSSITPTATSTTPTFTGTSSQATSSVSAGTPAGTIAFPANVPTFAGTPGTVPAQTFSGSSATTSATSAGTPAGTNSATATSGNCAATNIAAGTGSTTACKATAPNLTVPAETFAGSSMATHTHTLVATGTNSTAAFTPAGTVAWPTNPDIFSGTALAAHSHTLTPSGTVSTPGITVNAFDPSPPWVKVIFCSKN